MIIKLFYKNFVYLFFLKNSYFYFLAEAFPHIYFLFILLEKLIIVCDCTQKNCFTIFSLTLQNFKHLGISSIDKSLMIFFYSILFYNYYGLHTINLPK